MVLGPQFDFTSIPDPFGTKPVPEGHVRVNHFTSDEAIDNIRQHGLSMEKAHESFARGGTEFPSIFANAGQPSESLLRTRPVIEAHIPVKDLDIGRGNAPADLEKRQSTVTTNKDVPAGNILSVHEPWHQTFRYIQDDPSMESGVMSGMYDNTDESTDKAVNVNKMMLAGKVMLGGRLGRP